MTLAEIRRKLRGRNVANRSGENFFAGLNGTFLRTQTVVRCFYCGLLLLAILDLKNWGNFLGRTSIDPLWPVLWLRWVDLKTGIQVILCMYLLGTLAGAFRPEWRWARIFAFVGYVQFQAFHQSFGKIGHELHLWLIVSCFLMFLPALWHRSRGVSRLTKMKTVQIFWFAQAFVLMTYSMAGLGKIVVGLYQLSIGQVSMFDPHAMAIHVAMRLMETNSTSYLGSFVVDLGVWSWPGLLGTVYVQFTSFVVAFRPALHRWWGLVLICFHIGVYLVLTITFLETCLLLALLLFASPLGVREYSLGETLRALPGASLFLRRNRS